MNVNARVELWRTAASDLRRRPAGGEHDPGSMRCSVSPGYLTRSPAPWNA
jgi:hypothetical protein